MQYSSKVEICGVNTQNLPVLKEAKKKELLCRSREGDKKAREELISGNLKLGILIATVFPVLLTLTLIVIIKRKNACR